MSKVYGNPMPRTAAYLRKLGYGEKSIQEITGLSLLEVLLHRLQTSKEGLKAGRSPLPGTDRGSIML